MGINVRTKGQTGEREVAKMHNDIIADVRRELNLEQFATVDELFQRNQNQSAVGGSDLSNPLHLDIEVKRQEQLSVNTWWKQTVEAASRSGGIPILIYRQNRKPWNVVMLADLPLQPQGASYYTSLSGVRVTVSLDVYKQWFRIYYRAKVFHET